MHVLHPRRRWCLDELFILEVLGIDKDAARLLPVPDLS